MLGALRRSLFIPLVEHHRGQCAHRYQREVDVALGSPRARIAALQEAKFRSMVLHAYRTVPFYRRHYVRMADLLEAEEWPELQNRLPLITKADIREQNADFISCEFDVRNLRKSGTGGTTSSPIDLYLDTESWSKRQACTRFFMRWYGHRPGDRIAYLWGARQDFPGGRGPKWHAVNYLTYQSLMLPSSMLNDCIMREYYSMLRRFRPKVLQAYPTPLYYFARFLTAHRLRLDIPTITTTAEPLLQHQREIIEATFQTRVFNWYGARELGHAASECPCHQGMHVNAYGLRFEVLREDGAIADEGAGELVITDLENRCMPLIRYQIGDCGVLSQRRCPCGSCLPFIEEVAGRTADVFKRRDGTLIPGISLANRLIRECSAIAEFQIVQEDYETFTLRIVKGREYRAEALAEVERRIREYMQTDLVFRVQYLDEIPREPSGKIRFCVSKL